MEPIVDREQFDSSTKVYIHAEENVLLICTVPYNGGQFDPMFSSDNFHCPLDLGFKSFRTKSKATAH